MKKEIILTKKNLSKEAIQSRIIIIKALKIAINETEKLNKLVDEMHDFLHANDIKKAA